MNNYTTITFPGLGLEMNPARTVTIGPLSIHFYGLIIACGLILAVLYACKRASMVSAALITARPPPPRRPSGC